MNPASSTAEPESGRLHQTASTAGTKLSILLVNYNGARYLGACLESIHQFAPPETQVILEDNGSTDGSVEIAESKFSWLQVIRANRNLGFAAGNNLAATRASGEFILLLNTDTQLLEPIAPAVEWLKDHPEYGAITIEMLDGNRKPAACAGRFPTPLRLALLRTLLLPPHPETSKSFDVDWVQGSFLLIRAHIWRALRGLDEEYFMYGEDVDLCRRVNDFGFCCACLPRWRYMHWGGFNTKRFPDQIRGMATYVDKHMVGIEKLLCSLMLLGGCLVRAIVFHVRAIVAAGKTDRTRANASWDAFVALVQHRNHRISSDEFNGK